MCLMQERFQITNGSSSIAKSHTPFVEIDEGMIDQPSQRDNRVFLRDCICHSAKQLQHITQCRSRLPTPFRNPLRNSTVLPLLLFPLESQGKADLGIFFGLGFVLTPGNIPEL